ncbi:MAG TPA: DUF1638 domain-containing protein [Candidatus Ozemobacteraceae bacterium]|nr:DUF1638 domain-containing protein [Candidatus Ozemobacteraceae bacterium]
MSEPSFRPQDDLEVISCSVVRPELEHLRQSGEFPYPVSYIDSEMHMRPQELGQTIGRRLQTLLRAGKRVLLVYGDCHAAMVDMEQSPRVSRTEALNCVELLISKQQRREWLERRFFFLLPEWLERWESILLRLPGMTREQCIDLFHREHRGLVYLDTGVIPTPTVNLLQCSETLALLYEILPTGLDHFRSVLHLALLKLHREDART